jgi:hypothetical protein
MAAPDDLGAAGFTDGFVWGSEPRVDSWNVYRAPLPGLSAANYGACFLSGLPTPAFSDAESPAPGQGFAYFVAGTYTSAAGGLPVEGSLGNDSAGNVRPNIAPCP